MKNNNPKGILLIFIGMFIVSFQDATFKYIYSSVSLYEVYLIRTLISFGVIALLFKNNKQTNNFFYSLSFAYNYLV